MSELTKPEQAAADRADELILFSDAMEDAGHPELARRSRLAARDVLDLARMLEAERSARRSLQARNAEWERIVLKGVYQEILREEQRIAARAAR
ncbi:MAG TPA: hypothetical protein VF094_08840 [Gaiellaceae bacterium]